MSVSQQPTVRAGPPLVLFVCRANLVRSPVAAARFNDWAGRGRHQGLAAASAGTRARTGDAAPPEALREASAHGLDLASHRSRRLSPLIVEHAELVVTMTETQRDAVRTAVPRAVSRTFTLRELVRLCDFAAMLGMDLSELAEAAHRVRPYAPGPQEAEDVGDVVAGSRKSFQKAVTSVISLTDALTARLA